MANEERMNADEIEREIAATRTRVDMTLDSIQRKFSAGQLLDEALHYVKENGSGARWRASVVENPWPALAFGAAAAWFAWSALRSYERRELAEQRWARLEKDDAELIDETTYEAAPEIPAPAALTEPQYSTLPERDDPFKA